MTLARQILPGKTYLITRRCSQRQFLLRPSDTINQICSFCLFYAAQKYHIQVHAFCFMSDHYHLVVTDPEGMLPKFQHWLNAYIAKCINQFLDREENLWTPGSYSAVRIETEEITASYDILEKMVYTLTNPVSAGLVRYSFQWPGLWSAPSSIGKGILKTRRSKKFFHPDGSIPKTASITLVPPPTYSDMPEEAFSKLLREKIEEKEKIIHKRFEAEGRTFMGAKKVKAQSCYDRAVSREAKRELNPRIACKDKKKRIQVLEDLKQFFSAYRKAWKRYCEGVRDVIFPAGTYKMRVVYGVHCHSPP